MFLWNKSPRAGRDFQNVSPEGSWRSPNSVPLLKEKVGLKWGVGGRCLQSGPGRGVSESLLWAFSLDLAVPWEGKQGIEPGSIVLPGAGVSQSQRPWLPPQPCCKSQHSTIQHMKTSRAFGCQAFSRCKMTEAKSRLAKAVRDVYYYYYCLMEKPRHVEL